MAENIPLLRRAWSVYARRMYLNEIMLAKGIYVTAVSYTHLTLPTTPYV